MQGVGDLILKAGFKFKTLQTKGTYVVGSKAARTTSEIIFLFSLKQNF